MEKYLLTSIKFPFRFGESSMHIMDECVLEFKIAFAITKNSIYKKEFNKKMLQLIESGLTKKYLIDEKDKIGKEAKSDNFGDVQALKLDHMNAIVALILLLLGFCCLCFAFEILTGFWYKKND